MSEKYQGWTNYGTWAVALWIDNDPKLYEHKLEITKSLFDGNGSDENKLYDLTKNIEFWVIHKYHYDANIKNRMLEDLIVWAIELVDYRQIAKAWIADYKEGMAV